MRYAWILLLSSVLFAGCGKQAVQLAEGWTPPVKVTDSQNALDGGGDLYKWHDRLILMNERQDWVPHSSICSSSTCSMLIRNNDSSNAWTQLPAIQVSGYYAFYCPTFDIANDRIMFQGGRVDDNQLQISVVFVRMTASHGIQIEPEKKWTTDAKTLFGGSQSVDVRLTERPGTSGRLYLGTGIIYGSSLYFPCCVDGFTYNQAGVAISRGPNMNGVFHSADSGSTWQIERISDFDSFTPTACGTKGSYYYFATGIIGVKHGFTLWFSRKSVEDSSWEKPKELKKTIPSGVDARYIATTEDDTVHLVWLDNRHTKWRFTLEGPVFEDCEVAYCHRKDADTTWTKDAILSKGILDSYAPCVSVEGDKIVVAWSGNQTDRACPWERDPNDIYYTTSKDGGKTWAKPLQVTDVAKDGITAGHPQIAVQNGVIHLLYTQGKEDPQLQVSNQGPWPVYYQQRPFPN